MERMAEVGRMTSAEKSILSPEYLDPIDGRPAKKWGPAEYLEPPAGGWFGKFYPVDRRPVVRDPEGNYIEFGVEEEEQTKE